jgi:hypothetical protein
LAALVPLLALASSACIPQHLQKYRHESEVKAQSGSARVAEAPAPEPGTAPLPSPAMQTAPAPAVVTASPASAPAGQRATIYALDRHTFRFQLRDAEVWDAALNVLLRNYTLTIVDRQTGVITTEWDSYFLGNAVYRNKLSLRVQAVQRGAVDVTLHNSVERLRDAAQATGSVGAVWLPAEDPASEIQRVVQNMALVLNQPPPVMPPSGALAKGVGAAGAPVQR